MEFNRRQFLINASAALLSAGVPMSAVFAQNLPGLQEGEDFSFAALIELAKRTAKETYKPLDESLPDWAAQLTGAAYASITNKQLTILEKSAEARDIALEPLPRGFIYRTPVAIAVLRKGRVEALGYKADKFEWNRGSEAFDKTRIGYSGFKLRTKPSFGNAMEDLAVFQAASFYRAQAIGQLNGVMARGLAIGPAEVKGEEFPNFKAFWFDEVAKDGSVVFYAWLDSVSLSGAYKFKLEPGAQQTRMHVEAYLFARNDVSHLGLAPMTSMFYFAPHDRKGIDDLRPAAHRSEGLQILSGSGEWIWRPLNNPETLQTSSFIDFQPKGFGLVQRQKQLAAFEDFDLNFHQRPSLWVETLGEWGEGAVSLIEIPSENENYENIMAYWRPKKALKAGESLQVGYVQHWGIDVVPLDDRARAVGFRSGKSIGSLRKFMVTFKAPERWKTFPVQGLHADLTAAGKAISDSVLQLSEDGQLIRVVFEADVANLNSIEFRLILVADEGIQSETWLYRWTP